MKYSKRKASYWHTPDQARSLDLFLNQHTTLNETKDKEEFCHLLYNVWFGLTPHLHHVIRHIVAKARYGYCGPVTLNMNAYAVYTNLLSIDVYNKEALSSVYSMVLKASPRYTNLKEKCLNILNFVQDNQSLLNNDTFKMACGFLTDLSKEPYALEFAILHGKDVTRLQLFWEFVQELVKTVPPLHIPAPPEI